MITRLIQWLARLANVTVILPGADNDGLSPFSSGTDVDKPWHQLQEDITDARTAWRVNPLARRIVHLIAAYVVGNGIRATSQYTRLNQFIAAFWHHRQNLMDMRLEDWCEELSRSGELFILLFTNPVDGMSYVRTVPADQIIEIEWKEGDYETELRYRQQNDPGAEEIWWLSPHHPAAQTADQPVPIMLHYAVNRPIGAVRGESDLAPILKWLKRYSRWLEDRIRLNAGVRSFLWVVYAPQRLLSDLRTRYSAPPSPGSVLVAEDGAERWEAVTPNLQARDASADGRAIRWMIAAGGPGTGLVDLGEGEDANLATAKAMGEQRRRFLRRRQDYFAFLLADLIVHAANRQRRYGRIKLREVTIADVTILLPDISVEDNANLASAAATLIRGMLDLGRLIGVTPQFRATTLRLFMKFAGEQLGDDEIDALLHGEQVDSDLDGADPESDDETASAQTDNANDSAGDAAIPFRVVSFQPTANGVRANRRFDHVQN